MKQFYLFPPNLRGIRASRGNTIMEYAIILSLVMAVFYAMNVYFKRGVQGKVKDLTDEYISNGISSSDRQSTVNDDFVSTTATTTRSSDVTEGETIYTGGGRRATLDIPQATNIVDSASTSIIEDQPFIGPYTPVEDSNSPPVPLQQ